VSDFLEKIVWIFTPPYDPFFFVAKIFFEFSEKISNFFFSMKLTVKNFRNFFPMNSAVKKFDVFFNSLKLTITVLDTTILPPPPPNPNELLRRGLPHLSLGGLFHCKTPTTFLPSKKYFAWKFLIFRKVFAGV
jgi:hypothetical protein